MPLIVSSRISWISSYILWLVLACRLIFNMNHSPLDYWITYYCISFGFHGSLMINNGWLWGVIWISYLSLLLDRIILDMINWISHVWGRSHWRPADTRIGNRLWVNSIDSLIIRENIACIDLPIALVHISILIWGREFSDRRSSTNMGRVWKRLHSYRFQILFNIYLFYLKIVEYNCIMID